MAIVNLSNSSIKKNFQQTGLPDSYLERYTAYLKGLDWYYFTRELNTPRIPTRIYVRASHMTETYGKLRKVGYSHEFVDGYVRRALDIPTKDIILSPEIEYVKDYIESSTEDPNTTNHNLELYYSRLESKRYIKDLERLKKHPFKYVDEEDEDYNEQEYWNKTHSLMRTSLDLIYKLDDLMMNKHLRRHAAVSNNEKFLDQIIVPVKFAQAVWAKSYEFISQDEDKALIELKDRTIKLENLMETVKDLYLLYD